MGRSFYIRKQLQLIFLGLGFGFKHGRLRYVLRVSCFGLRVKIRNSVDQNSNATHFPRNKPPASCNSQRVTRNLQPEPFKL